VLNGHAHFALAVAAVVSLSSSRLSSGVRWPRSPPGPTRGQARCFSSCPPGPSTSSSESRSLSPSGKRPQILGGLSPVAGEPADLPDVDRVRILGQNAIHRIAELRPVAAAARVILIRKHVDKVIRVAPSGPLDACGRLAPRIVCWVPELFRIGSTSTDRGWWLVPLLAGRAVCG
jgi:hypothetical protein